MMKLTNKIVKLTTILFLLTSFVGMQSPTLALADTDSGTGPGGVGSTDGTSDLVLWLDANDISGSDESLVSSWSDKSGWENDASQMDTNFQPVLQTLEINEQSTVRFQNVDWLKVLDSDELDGTSGLSIYTVVNPTTIDEVPRGIVSKRISSSNRAYSLFFNTFTCPGETLCLTIDITTTRYTSYPYTFTPGNPTQIAVLYNGDGNSSAVFVDADFKSSAGVVSSIANVASDLTLGTMNENYGAFYQGDIAETIIYRKSLNAVERLLVENYLSSKYDIDISASGLDRYDGDTDSNGNFDLNVAGIGREADGSNITAFSTGMVVQNNTYLADDGDYLIFGHRNITNTITTYDLPWVGDPSASRWLRHWYVDVTDITTTTGGTVDIYFDFSDGGIQGSPTGDGSNYKLLMRSGTSGSFNALDYTASIVGDRVVFTNVSVTNLGSNFTLGTVGRYTLDVDKDGSGSGTVSSVPDGIDCGSDCSEDFAYSTVVTLTATAEVGSIFSSWSGDCSGNSCVVSMDSAKTVTATFNAVTPTTCYTLTISHTGQGSDPVANLTNSTGCPSGQYVEGETINLSGAIPETGWQISSWTGTSQDDSIADTNSLTMPARNHTVSVIYMLYSHFPLIYRNTTTTTLETIPGSKGINSNLSTILVNKLDNKPSFGKPK